MAHPSPDLLCYLVSDSMYYMLHARLDVAWPMLL